MQPAVPTPFTNHRPKHLSKFLHSADSVGKKVSRPLGITCLKPRNNVAPQPNYEPFSASHRTNARFLPKTVSLHRRKWWGQNTLQATKVTLELTIPEGLSLRGRCMRIR